MWKRGLLQDPATQIDLDNVPLSISARFLVCSSIQNDLASVRIHATKSRPVTSPKFFLKLNVLTVTPFEIEVCYNAHAGIIDRLVSGITGSGGSMDLSSTNDQLLVCHSSGEKAETYFRRFLSTLIASHCPCVYFCQTWNCCRNLSPQEYSGLSPSEL